ncbi:mannose-ethanolamine phosphotransferase MCD4 [Pneumocystis jirovecii RU7]|uniref:GPI ethanolamine phosphate transferase 1 n=1 Tax=Pneumocystis jirovecii (strain RU7) TaxID=1408657 RepID=A0A0W4ZMM0_PNEJ7|nr:mannose-ethanolamine phosphotransferase MCD4 [Pneumocystis jirovecii RU7]KTW29623.1 hypothetical protein T551_02239 [Pneumocystis jirovecii RU7]
MSCFSRKTILIIGVLFHLIYLRSIFDIYFTSPLVHGMQQFKVESHTPAKRLFLIIGDGLRADKLFESHLNIETNTYETFAPFLHSIVLDKGCFGVSHTRVPTESRPGHVAIIAGFYEDVSAITRGWKTNPVNFDSIFNQSRHTWSFGSPDILPMFAYGASDVSRVETFMYEKKMEDFSKSTFFNRKIYSYLQVIKDSTILDTWVFDKVTELFKNSTSNKTIKKALSQDKIVFFLHLLGLDTAGHSYRPYSKEYLNNIKVVDTGLKKIVKLVENYYNDDKTAWIFTSDHGMSNLGSHGDGHPDNTRTPLIVWGPGINKPDKLNVTGHDNFSKNWSVNIVKRIDVLQADIAPLMAYLVGLNFPMNSVGRLPLDYLSCSPNIKSQIALTNALQIAEQYKMKHELKSSTKIAFKPFKHLNNKTHNLDIYKNRIETLIDNYEYDKAIKLSKEMIELCLAGLNYFQTYDRLFLHSIITLGYVGWIVFMFIQMINSYIPKDIYQTKRTFFSSAVFLSILFGLFTLIYVEKSPLFYCAYIVFPIFFWEHIFINRRIIYKCLELFSRNIKKSYKNAFFFLDFIIYSSLLESIVIGYSQRKIFTGYFILISFWPLTYGIKFVQNNKTLVFLWILNSLTISIFTLLDTVKKENLALILTGGFFMLLSGIIYLIFGDSLIKKRKIISKMPKVIISFQLGLLILSMIVTHLSVLSLRAKKGLPFGNQVLGWMILVLSLLVPLLVRKKTYYVHKLFIIFLMFSPIFIILSISYEALFYVCFFSILVLWVEMEHKVRLTKAQDKNAEFKKNRKLFSENLRTSLFYLFFIQEAFFGTGNIASVSSFSLDSVYRLIVIFNPFFQATILLFKLLIPFIIISANLGILNRKLEIPPSTLFMIVLTMSDILTLNFFYLVKNEGSWFEIGSTISTFCIGNFLIIYIIILEKISDFLIGNSYITAKELEPKKN